MHDLGRGVPLAPSSQPTFNGRRRTSGRLRHSSRRCNPSLKDDVIERSPASPRATRRVTKLSPPMTRCTAGHVSPLASLVDCNLARVEIGRVSHDARFSNALGRLSHFRSLHVTVDPNRVEKPRSQDHDRDPMRRARARANGHALPSSPKRVWVLEAPGDAPPLPPSGWARVANGSR
jgi:hypothetical protein